MAEPVIVVGGGAAGLVAAVFAAEGGRPVVVLERMADGGRKILISGGGRCNVLPGSLDEERFVTASSPNTLRKILRSWPLTEQRRFFEREVGLTLVLEEETGKLFPSSNRARDVRDGLQRLARERGVELRGGSAVRTLTPRESGGWTAGLDSGEGVAAAAVILATGGLSVPATGSDGTGLRIAAELGHRVHATYPALTPLTAEPHRHAALAGVSLVVELTAGEGRETVRARGGFLVTHRGYSGPSVLDVSHVAVRSRIAGLPSAPIRVRWTELDADGWSRAFQEERRGTASSLLRKRLPSRLAESLLTEIGVPAERSLAQLRRDERTRLIAALTAYDLPWTGDEGYKKAEVTGGGVALDEVDPRTLESRRQPGLFLCGEILDAFGPIGGYNFCWAWATGRAAGRGAANHGVTS
jgi:predicted Rossmann fold flavoprotein